MRPMGMARFIGAAVAVAVLMPFGAAASDDTPRGEAAQVRTDLPSGGVALNLAIENRKLRSGIALIQVRQHAEVVLRWTSDEEVRLHLHGYDIEATVTPGETTEMRFEAFATGRFPITSHGFGAAGDDDHGGGHGGESALIYLEVHPD